MTTHSLAIYRFSLTAFLVLLLSACGDDHPSDSPDSVCGDGVLGADEECDGLAFSDVSTCGDGYPHCRADCTVACTECGDGILEVTPAGLREECDDGNQIDGDGCSDCKLARCGDGITDDSLEEGCDEGAANSNAPGAACRVDCQPRRCGDGILDEEMGEVCDDGNTSGNDGCSPDCRSKVVCGNGYVDAAAGEQCDDGNHLSRDGCSSNCLAEAPLPIAQREPHPRPPEHFFHAMAYDASRGRIVWYGGLSTQASGPNTATWEWDGDTWTKVASGGPAPSLDRTMTYDAARQRVVLSNEGYWEWNGARWTPLPAVPGPSPIGERQGLITYDARREKLIAFNGSLWEWDSKTHVWRNLSPTSDAPKPTYEQARAIVYDPSVGLTILVADGIWEWDGGARTWTRATPPLLFPPDLNEPIVYDTRLRRVVFAIGTHDTFEWDSRTRTLTAGATFPGLEEPLPCVTGDVMLRHGSAMAHHAGLGKTIRAGGFSTTAWELDGARWRCLEEPLLELPGGPYLKVYDDRKAQTLALGVGDEDRNWISKGVAWRSFGTATLRPPVTAEQAAYDIRRDRVVAISSAGVEPELAQEMWEWDGVRWRTISTPFIPEHPTVRHLITAPARRTVVSVSHGASHEWDGQVWTFLAEDYNIPPDTRVVYDRVRERAMRFGAFDPFNLFVWELTPRGDPATFAWTSTRSLGPPLQLEQPYFWFDPDRQRTLHVDFDGVVWEWNGTRWTDVSLGVARAMSPHGGSPLRPLRPSHSSFAIGPTVRFGNRLAREESCSSGFDVDGDGLIGCADPDCWRTCSPTCSPGQRCPTNAPRCGDGVCNAYAEDCRSCPGDCGTCPPACGDFLCDPGETAAACPGDCR